MAFEVRAATEAERPEVAQLIREMIPGVAADQRLAWLYEKNPASNASYSYEALKVPETMALFEAQLRTQAARGFRLDVPVINKGVADEEHNVYVKDMAQAATFDIRLLDFASTSTEGLARANAQGIDGYGWQGSYQVPRNPKGGLNDLYVRANNCAGALCDVQSSMGYY